MTIEQYDSQIRRIDFEKINGKAYWIINQSYWYNASTTSKEEAIEKYKKLKGIK